MATGTASATTSPPPPVTGDRPSRFARAPWVGLGVTVLLVVVAFVVPEATGWHVYPRSTITPDDIAPLHGLWDPKWWGPGTLPSVLIAALGARYGIDLAERLTWRRLLLASYVVAVAWLVSLAFVDGPSGISRVLGSDFEYLPTARSVHDVGATLHEFIDRIPYSAAPDNWPTHVAGHPPGALLFFVLLVRVGLGGDFAAGMVVTVLAATTAPAVLCTLRTLGREDLARRAAPFLVLAPAAIFMAVSADAMYGAVAAWGVAALAVAATRGARRSTIGWSVVAGLLFGTTVMLSYGLALMALVALAVLAAVRSWRPIPVVAAAALAVVLAFVPFGFAWWRAYPVLNDRYWDGLAADRPAAYWMWGNLAALAVCAGPLLGAGLARAATLGRHVDGADRTARLLVGAAALAIVIADASRMSKAEVERIWLPFVPWLMVSCALLPPRWRRWGLGLQVVAALAVQQLLYTSW